MNIFLNLAFRLETNISPFPGFSHDAVSLLSRFDVVNQLGLKPVYTFVFYPQPLGWGYRNTIGVELSPEK